MQNSTIKVTGWISGLDLGPYNLELVKLGDRGCQEIYERQNIDNWYQESSEPVNVNRFLNISLARSSAKTGLVISEPLDSPDAEGLVVQCAELSWPFDTSQRCECVAGHSGAFCEDCAPGYERTRSLCCPRGWREFGGHCYFLLEDNKVAEDCRTHCFRFDAELASIESQEENNFLAGYIAERHPREKKIGKV